MAKTLIKLLFALIATFLATSFCHAAPWFTGPLLAPPGHTIPVGHSVFEPYYFFTSSTAVYDNHWHPISTPLRLSNVFNPILTYGLTNKIDVQFNSSYLFNIFNGQTFQHVGDTSMTLGFQTLEQKESRWIPDLRVSLQQVIPTGRFSSLNPLNNGTDASGLGSYQTALALNFQHLTEFKDNHYLRMRFSLAYYYATNVHLQGVTAYGGDSTTDGKLNPGNQISADLAAEYSLNQHWVAVLESYFANRAGSTFTGNPGNGISNIGYLGIAQITLAPAIEYNFNKNIGIITGYWRSLTGRNSAVFNTGILAINIFW